MKNIKLFFIIAFIAMFSFSCQRQPSYTITGTVANPEMEGKKVILVVGDRQVNKQPKIDSTVISNGKYTFNGNTEELNSCWVVINPHDRENAIGIFVALENVDITINTDTDGWSTVSGSDYNDEYQKFRDTKRGPDKKWRDVSHALRDARKAGTLTPEQEENWSKEQEMSRNEVKVLTFDFVKNHINNPATWSELHNCAISQPVEQQKEMIAGANERTLRAPEVIKVQERIRTLEKTAIGQPFTDLRMADPEGKEIALSDYVGKGKYVLIDFWASWCGPCRAEMPYVVAAYEKYKDKGFEIVGVSLDMKHESWVKAIKDLNLPWVHISDLKGWECEGVKLYAVTGVPHAVLIDKEGIIIVRDVRGEELQEKLAELIGNK